MNIITEAEIFSAGKWNGIEFTVNDIEAIVDSFHKLSLSERVPLKLGHNPEQPVTDGQPALGWVKRVWRDGSKILAEFVDLPNAVFEAITKKLYKFVSVELMQEVEAEAGKFPWVLSAVSLLGADIPAVRNLAELKALAMTRNPGLRGGSLVAFKRDTLSPIEVSDMTDKAELELAQLREKIATFTSENASLKAKMEESQQKLLDTIKGHNEEKATSLKKEADQKFEQAIEAKQILPAARERFFKYVWPKDTGGVLAFEMKDLDEYIKENQVATFKHKKETQTVHNDQTEEEGLDPDTIVSKRADALLASDQRFTGKTYFEAQMEVLRVDPELAEKYRTQPGVK